jgi:transcriptional regulator with XRE-family HTH domain
MSRSSTGANSFPKRLGAFGKLARYVDTEPCLAFGPYMHANPLPNRIRELREKLGMTQQELADLMGVNKKDVSRYETGFSTLNIEWMQRFARALRVHPQDLLNIVAMSASADEVVALPPEDVGITYAALKARGIVGYKVLGDAVAETGVAPGQIIFVDTTQTDPACFPAGALVLASINGHLVLRQYMPPRKLITNSASVDVVARLDDPNIDIAILGTLIRE